MTIFYVKYLTSSRKLYVKLNCTYLTALMLTVTSSNCFKVSHTSLMMSHKCESWKVGVDNARVAMISSFCCPKSFQHVIHGVPPCYYILLEPQIFKAHLLLLPWIFLLQQCFCENIQPHSSCLLLSPEIVLNFTLQSNSKCGQSMACAFIQCSE